MRVNPILLSVAGAALTQAQNPGKFIPLEVDNPAAAGPEYEIIERDVLILGGGATGCYAAVRLRDQGKSVAVIEKSTILGGHVNTFMADGKPIEYGAQAYISNNFTTDFFGRFNVTLNVSGVSTLPTVVANFLNGTIDPSAKATNPMDDIGALIQYLGATLNFTGIAEGAYDLPNPVPEDLLLPFGQFVEKYHLQGALPVVWIFAHGTGDMLNATTLYVLQNFGQQHLLGLQAGYLHAVNGNQELYDKAAAFLGTDVFFNSTVARTNRTANGTLVLLNSNTPKPVMIKAKKMLVTIPPTFANTAVLGLAEDEYKLFAQWRDVPYYVGVVENKAGALADLTTFENRDPSQPFSLPAAPFVLKLETMGVPGYQTVKVIGEADSDKAQGLVRDAIAKLAEENGMAAGGQGTLVKFAAWEQHKDLVLQVAPEAVRAGFYRDLYALQGKRSTFWTGNAWCSDYSPLLWQFTEKRILPNLL